ALCFLDIACLKETGKHGAKMYGILEEKISESNKKIPITFRSGLKLEQKLIFMEFQKTGRKANGNFQIFEGNFSGNFQNLHSINSKEFILNEKVSIDSKPCKEKIWES
ncbi:hypothetical protein SK128_014759, partial [Halocaridina rubra]